MASIKDFAGDAALYGLGRALKKLMGLLLLPFYTRALSPAEYGVMDLLSTGVYLIIVIITLGLNDAGARYFYMQETNRDKGRILYSSLVTRVVLATVVSLILAGFSKQISMLLFDTEVYKWAVLISSALIVARVMSEDQSSIFRLYRKAIGFNVLLLGQSLVNIGLGVLLVLYLDWGVTGVQLASLISVLLALILGYVFFTKDVYVFEFDKTKLKLMLAYGVPLIGAALLNWVQGVSDRYFLLYYADLTQIGLYSIGSTFSQPLVVINTAVLLSHGVIIMSTYQGESDEDKPQTKKLSNQILHSYLAISAPIIVLLSLFSTFFIQFVTTPDYVQGAVVVPLLGFASMMSVLYIISGFGMDLMLKSKYYFWLMLVSASLNVGLNFYFVPKFGFFGAGMTTLFSNFIYMLMAFYFSQKFFHIPRKITAISAFLIFDFSAALVAPISELKFGVVLPIGVKFLILIAAFLSPFIFRLITRDEISQLNNMIRTSGKTS